MPLRAVREQIVSAIDLIVQYTRFADGTRRITQVSEVSKIDPEFGEIIVEDIFIHRFHTTENTGILEHTGYIPSFFSELMRTTGVSLDTLFGCSERSSV